MSFGENLQFYRKRDNITQEQLAESLHVSRQSVSKWESDSSFPEMDKLLQLCDMFSCDLDTLTRGNAKENTAEDTACYDAHMNSRSKWMAVGVGLLLFGIGLPTILESVGVGEELSGSSFLLCVAAAVVIFVIKGMQHESFRRRYPYIGQFYSEDTLYAFEKKFPLLVAIPVAVIILDLACNNLLESAVIKMGMSGEICTGLFFWILGAAIATLVYGAMQKEKYDIKAYNKENDTSKEKINKWCGVIMLIATSLFLLSLAVTAMGYMQAKDAGLAFSWRSSILAFSWMVFPLGGIGCGIVSIILSKEEKKEV